ncbi:acetylxylan esterase [Sporocytophaga myxococcoides]|uniref:Acetylxylan esterase n=1 Tax=Sporocytophaga myxococcoides TaxID=153721 RepID=A0A098LFT7_9BACT|nr:NlpC/P60 family protein [Sporocytophaga myxococcoides]GAL85826.1 acetylxylan esterase [Sporocytophaga myxococcoides]
MNFSFLSDKRTPALIIILCLCCSFSFSDGGKVEQLINSFNNPGIRNGLKTFFRGGAEKQVSLGDYSVEELIKEANSFLGTPHRMGGTSKKGIDCSGLVRVTHKKFGILLPHSSHEQARYGDIVPSKDSLESGDLVFFYNSYNSRNFITHAGIYLGEEKFIHASHSQGVIISSINDGYWGKRFLFGTRLGGVKVDEASFYKSVAADSFVIKVSADHPYIQYSGRIDLSDKKKPGFTFPGVTVSAKFIGNSIGFELNDFGGNDDKTANYYTVLINGQISEIVKCIPGVHIYQIKKNLKDTIHEITIFKRTESSVGKSEFIGFVLGRNGKLVRPANKPLRKIEFIGDSYTCGYGNSLIIPAPPEGNPNTGFSSANEDNYSAWGNLVSQRLNAQYMCTAYSGKGMYRNFQGDTTGTLPKIYDRVFPDQELPKWNFERYIPDLIVIHLGTNDFYQEVSGNSKLDSSGFVNQYTAFVKNVRELFPAAKIVCVPSNGLNDSWPPNAFLYAKSKRYVESVVTSIKEAGDKNIYSFVMVPQSAPFGEDWHPSLHTHESMAQQIVPYLKKITGWE